MGSFRARLRHLKSVGVPNIPKVGSGTQIVYEIGHLIDMYIALLVIGLGISPKVAAFIVFAIKNEIIKSLLDADDNDVFCIIDSSIDNDPSPQFSTDFEVIKLILKNGSPPAVAMLNVSKAIRDVHIRLRDKYNA